eukprot:1883022-Prymnesium_polylepis.3
MTARCWDARRCGSCGPVVPPPCTGGLWQLLVHDAGGAAQGFGQVAGEQPVGSTGGRKCAQGGQGCQGDEGHEEGGPHAAAAARL